MMTSRTFIATSTACATLLGVALIAEDNPPPTAPANINLAGIPSARGIYYRASNEWVTLSHTVLMPFDEQRSVALEVLNVGSDHAEADIPGRHSMIQIGNDSRPTFYLHGISPQNLYLIHMVPKYDYREIVMPISRHFKEWAHYRDKDLTDLGILAVNGDIVAIKPTTNLRPGEYALATPFDPSARWLRLGFDFGILGPVAH